MFTAPTPEFMVIPLGPDAGDSVSVLPDEIFTGAVLLNSMLSAVTFPPRATLKTVPIETLGLEKTAWSPLTQLLLPAELVLVMFQTFVPSHDPGAGCGGVPIKRGGSSLGGG